MHWLEATSADVRILLNLQTENRRGNRNTRKSRENQPVRLQTATCLGSSLGRSSSECLRCQTARRSVATLILLSQDFQTTWHLA